MSLFGELYIAKDGNMFNKHDDGDPPPQGGANA